MKATDLGQIVTHLVNKKGDTVSNKKLQKLLYYVEAWHLVNFDTALLEEDFEAWVHGPVLPTLYRELKEHGYNDIAVINAEGEEGLETDTYIQNLIIRNDLSVDSLELIDAVLAKYGPLSSFTLEMLSHNEAPWIEARGGIPPHASCNTIIPKPRMKEFYSSIV